MKKTLLKWLILIVIFLALCYVNVRYEVFALNFPKVQGKEKSEGCIRVMSWNVNASLGFEDLDFVKYRLISEIDKQDPDILCIQELSYSNFLKMQASLDSLFGYTDFMEIKKEPLRYWIYSKKPIRNFKYYGSKKDIDTDGYDQRLKKEFTKLKRQLPIYSAEIEVEPKKWITVFSVHLRSSAYSTARRSMDKGASWEDGLPLYLQNYKIGAKIRNYEADNLRLYLDSLETKNTPIIAAGDFNDWSGSYCMNTIRDGKYKDTWWKGGFGFGITYNEWHLKLRLDHILFNHNFKLEKVFVERSGFSDHYPVIADFYLR